MPVVHFQCPQCQAPLRLENRALFLGRIFPCPDCAANLLIESNGSDGVSARLTTASVAAKPERSDVPSVKRTLPTEAAPVQLTDLGVNLQPRLSVLDKIGQRPTLLGWSVAALFAIVLWVFVSSGPEQPSRSSVTQPATDSLTKKDSATINSASTNQRNDEHAAAENQTESNRRLVQKASGDNAADPTSRLPAETEPFVPLDGESVKPKDKKIDVPVIPVPPEPQEPAVNEASELKPLKPTPQETDEKIEARLRQKIARFEQPKPVPFIKLLDIVEELAGVPIVWDLQTVDDEQLQKPVTLVVKQTTAGEILDELLRQVGLERRVAKGQIELLSASPKDK
jgi:hypothetical protein